jgi:hypothetical protein
MSKIGKHTAGPWLVDGVAIRAAGSDDLARVYMPLGMTLQEHNANASMMAASPELRTALEALWKWQATVQELVPDDVANLVTAALAKAKGQKP